MTIRKKKVYIDLFTGCGGLSLGLYNSNHWKGLFAVEKNKDAFSTLEHNLLKTKNHFDWPEWLPVKEHDILSFVETYKPQLENLSGTIDLVVGGPPCQGFSTAGKRQEDDKRNQLMHSYLQFIEIIKPKALLFENVKGFDIGFRQEDGSRGKPYSEYLINSLKEIGYKSVESRIVDFSEYGVPQQRRRFIVVATLDDNAGTFFDMLKTKKKIFFKRKNISEVISVSEAISDIERKHGEKQSPDSRGFMNGKYSPATLSNYQALMRKNCILDLPDSHRFVNHKKTTIEKFADIIKNKLTSKEVAKKYNTKKTSTSLLDASKPCLTLTTLPDDYVHYCDPRILTVREYARIQSFPDWYVFKGKYTTGSQGRKFEVPRYTQVGNAIPPLFGEQCGIILKDVIND